MDHLRAQKILEKITIKPRTKKTKDPVNLHERKKRKERKIDRGNKTQRQNNERHIHS